MVDISHESPQANEDRLRRVIAAAQLVVLDGAYAFAEGDPHTDPSAQDALVLVRDGDAWSWLAPAGDSRGERFTVFSFHFPGTGDHSGFVGWLAATIKRELGSGVFVVCGYNSGRGGVSTTGVAPSSFATRCSPCLTSCAPARPGQPALHRSPSPLSTTWC